MNVCNHEHSQTRSTINNQEVYLCCEQQDERTKVNANRGAKVSLAPALAKATVVGGGAWWPWLIAGVVVASAAVVVTARRCNGRRSGGNSSNSSRSSSIIRCCGAKVLAGGE